MSSKSVIQLIILIIIFIILGGVYLKYFSKEKIIIDQTLRQTDKEININLQNNNNKNKNENESANLNNKDKSKKEKISVDFQLEYGQATLEIHKDSISNGEKILIIDDLIATGGTAEAGAKLVEISKGKVAGFIFIINLFDLGGNDKLLRKSYFTKSLIDFPGH